MGDLIIINAYFEEDDRKEKVSMSRPHTVQHLMRKLDIDLSHAVIVRDKSIMRMTDLLRDKDKIRVLKVMRK